MAGSAGGRVARGLDRRQRSVTTQVLWVRPATPMTEEDQLTTPNIPGPVSRQPEPVSGKRVAIDAPRLWGGGVATAVVAALAAGVGVLVCRDLLHVKLVEPPLLNVTKSFAANYAVTAFVVALAATGTRPLVVGGHAAAASLLRLDRRSHHGRSHGRAVRSGGDAQGQDLRIGDQSGDRSLHCQSAIRGAVAHGRRRRTNVAAALVGAQSIIKDQSGAASSRLSTALSILPWVVPSERSVSVAARAGEMVAPSLNRSMTRGSTYEARATAGVLPR